MLQEEYNFWLANINNIGIKKIELLLQVFGSAEAVFYASPEEFEKFKQELCPVSLRFSDSDVTALYSSRNQQNIREKYAKLKKEGIYFVAKEDERYPDKLRSIYDAPFALYVKGSIPKNEEKILAVVGARDCSAYGKEMAKYLAGKVAKEGVSIVSGLARGIDAYAHEGTLIAGGITYGILGCGINICYPKENINLYMDVQRSGGIISEYAPGMKPIAGNFPMRNRIISGLSDAILVVEAKEKSGSLITVDMGLEQGKDIYALPGKVNDCLSEGCNNLIKMGAKLVTSPKDILEDFFVDYKLNMNEKKPEITFNEVSKDIYECLSLEPMYIEIIAERTKLKMDCLMEQLLLLELQGWIQQTRKNYYIISSLHGCNNLSKIGQNELQNG